VPPCFWRVINHPRRPAANAPRACMGIQLFGGD
jgi:hypothetical protein